MAAKFDQNDDSVVVIVGSGAGGGTLGNELAQKGVKVVVLEAGKRNEYDDFVNDEWESFAQLAWKDMRTTSGDWRVHKNFPNLPAWIVKSVGGSTTHWAGASLRFQEHEFKDADHLRPHPRRQSPRLADHARRPRALLRPRRGQDGRHAHQRPAGPAGQQQFQGDQGRAPTSSATRSATPAAWRSIRSSATAATPATRPASASRAANGARNGRRSTPRFPRARRPATWRFVQTRMSPRSSTTPPAK